MSMISTLSEVRRFRFVGSDSLYRDPHGRRVVADYEGAGHFLVEVAKAPLLILRDEVKTEAFPGSFANSLSVLAIGPGEVQVVVFRDLLPSGPTVETSSHRGAGWILEARGDLRVDGRYDPDRYPRPGLPLPFFGSVEADHLVVAPASARLELVDRWRIDDVAGLKARGWQVQNVSKVVTLESLSAEGVPYAAPVACHLNAASWGCSIPAENLGLRLRKTYDRFHGRQRARVFVEGEFAGWWYEPVEDRGRRWGVSEYGIPAGLTAGKTQVSITVDPPAGSPLWSVSDFEVWALMPLG